MAVYAIILSNVKDDADIIRNHHVSLKGYLKTGKELIMSNVFQFSNHAMSRLESRQISRDKVVKAVFCGQVFSSGKGLYKAKLWEHNGKMVDEYIVVFSKADKKVVTVEHNVKRADSFDEEHSKHQIRKIFKQHKRSVREREFNDWCREEYRHYNMPFPA